MLAYHQRRCRDEDAAHELTAETFAQVWLVRARFRDECDGSAAPWLFGIARNVLLVSVRRRALEARARERLGVQVTPVSVSPQEAWLEDLDDDDVPEAVRLRVVDELELRRDRRASSARPRAPRASAFIAAWPPCARRGPDDRPSERHRRRPRARRAQATCAATPAGAAACSAAPPRSPILLPGGALAAGLLSHRGRRALAARGHEVPRRHTPKCEVVKEGVEYHCTIKGALRVRDRRLAEGHRRADRRRDQARQRRLPLAAPDGREWRCYIGEEAVRQQIIGPDFLGEYAPSPGVG